MTDLGTLGSHLSSAFDINNNGQIVGQSPNGSYTHAFVYESGIMTDLGTLGGRHSRAEGINDNGLITGYAYIGDSERHAVIWAPDADNDGYYSDEDCDDTKPLVNPGALEDCSNGIDDNCNGYTDTDDPDCICYSTSECLTTEFCEKVPGNCSGQGTCQSRPGFCTTVWAPVCGCDGITYSNDCSAALAGVNVDYQGTCL